MGIKRDHTGETVPVRAAPGRFQSLFEGFRAELDEHYDRRERIVKASRDATALSKKIIFALHRSSAVNEAPSPAIQKEIDTHQSKLSDALTSIAPDLTPLNRHRYWLPCLEELVEALSFSHYLRTQTLLAPSDAQLAIPGGILMTERDYIYGIFDLFGEMMRFATAKSRAPGVLVADESEKGRSVMEDIRELGCAFETLPKVPEKAFTMKMETMRVSVKKVETLGYRMVIQRGEHADGWVPDADDDEREV
ncbi:related to translin-associated protein X [Cephalotrichum gorgonifer]|uniref:Related to translin-associated protein X n=1 Tax=Cephalotrichum gorgonifer TaxID=2041049 RepID=A0AAE8MX08_9PEZI|nr:related to translin-associated protein X [Cephalotrichum gorgonifer]